MNVRRVVLIVLGIVVVAFVVLQLIPVPARSNPAGGSDIQWNSPETEQLVRAACYDCHSNETRWPWYAYVAPVSWTIAHDVEEGRDAMNFSTQGADEISGEEAVEEIEEGAMPLAQYVRMHPEANLTDAQKETLIAGLEATLTGTEEGEEGEVREAGEEGEEDEAGEASTGG